MIDWLYFNGFSSFMYIIILLIFVRVLTIFVNKKIDDTDDCSHTSENSGTDSTDSDDEIKMEIRKDDLYNSIIAIRRLQQTIKKLNNKDIYDNDVSGTIISYGEKVSQIFENNEQ